MRVTTQLALHEVKVLGNMAAKPAEHNRPRRPNRGVEPTARNAAAHA